MTTGRINYEIGPKYKKAIISNEHTPAFKMSETLNLAKIKDKPIDAETVRKSLDRFKEKSVL